MRAGREVVTMLEREEGRRLDRDWGWDWCVVEDRSRIICETFDRGRLGIEIMLVYHRFHAAVTVVEKMVG